jgi:CheY-like chemotaxis protein
MATVLLVDDEIAVRMLTGRCLRGAGYDVVEAADGLQAWTYFQRQPFSIDALLTDVVMPQLTGTELAARVRQRRPELPVVLMSGYSPADLLARGLEASHGVLLTKPFTDDGLLALVRQVLGNGWS